MSFFLSSSSSYRRTSSPNRCRVRIRGTSNEPFTLYRAFDRRAISTAKFDPGVRSLRLSFLECSRRVPSPPPTKRPGFYVHLHSYKEGTQDWRSVADFL